VLFDALAQAEAAFAGLSWAALGRTGRPLGAAESIALGS
jgi:hypothetical protein